MVCTASEVEGIGMHALHLMLKVLVCTGRRSVQTRVGPFVRPKLGWDRGGVCPKQGWCGKMQSEKPIRSVEGE